MWTVFAGATSHVPSPPTTATTTVTAATRATPPSAIATPSSRNGIVLPIRWSKPPCRNGAHTMPSIPSSSRGSIPLRSRRPPATWSTTSTTHISAAIAATRIMPRTTGESVRERVSDVTCGASHSLGRCRTSSCRTSPTPTPAATCCSPRCPSASRRARRSASWAPTASASRRSSACSPGCCPPTTATSTSARSPTWPRTSASGADSGATVRELLLEPAPARLRLGGRAHRGGRARARRRRRSGRRRHAPGRGDRGLVGARRL